MIFLKRHYQEPPSQTLQPTFEDLSIDDNLSELQRLVRYSRSAIGLQRSVFMKGSFHGNLTPASKHKKCLDLT